MGLIRTVWAQKVRQERPGRVFELLCGLLALVLANAGGK